VTNISGGGSWSSRDTEAKKEARRRDGNTEITLRSKRSGQAEKREEGRAQRAARKKGKRQRPDWVGVNAGAESAEVRREKRNPKTQVQNRHLGHPQSWTR